VGGYLNVGASSFEFVGGDLNVGALNFFKEISNC